MVDVAGPLSTSMNRPIVPNSTSGEALVPKRRVMAGMVAAAAVSIGVALPGTAQAYEAPPAGTTGSALQSARIAQSLTDLAGYSSLLGWTGPAEGVGPTNEWLFLNLLSTGSGGEYCYRTYGHMAIPGSTCW